MNFLNIGTIFSWFKGKTKVKDKNEAKELFSTLINTSQEHLDVAIFCQEQLYKINQTDEYYFIIDSKDAVEIKDNKALIKFNNVEEWVILDNRTSYKQRLSILYSWKAKILENLIWARNTNENKAI